MSIRSLILAAAFAASAAALPVAGFAADAMSSDAMAKDGVSSGGAMAAAPMDSDMAMQDCMKKAEKETDAMKTAEMKKACETQHTDAMGAMSSDTMSGDAMAPQN